jgi:hypothetical protein
MRAAGIELIKTDGEPLTMVSGGPTQVAISVARAAGKPPIMTLGEPLVIGPPTCGFGPGSTIGQVCMSVKRAAGLPGTFSSAVC